MKRLLLPIALVLLGLSNAQSQDKRWMYLELSGKTIIEADTAEDDTQELSNYDGHDNVVVVWFKATEPVKSRTTNYKKMVLTKMAIDTSNKQVSYKYTIEYRNNKVFKSWPTEYADWHDIVPGSLGELFLEYARSLHDENLYYSFRSRALLHSIINASKNKK